MRIVFLGTPDFAAYSLKSILESGNNIVAVITAPDKKAGRGQKVQESAVKRVAIQHDIPCLQPKNLKDQSFIDELRRYKADLQIVVAFRMLPEVVWNMPPMGTMNLHASLLPSYRGAAPINWAIINGERTTGVSTFLLKHEIDTGEIIDRKEVKIDNRETAGSLHDKLMKEGAELLVRSIRKLIKGEARSTPQSELVPKGKRFEDLPEAPKIFREDCKINWDIDAELVDQKIRGLSPYPTAWTTLIKADGKQLNLKIYDCSPTDLISTAAGLFTTKDAKIYVHCGDKQLEILELQLEGKKRMSAKDFINGVNLDDYEGVLS